MRCRKARRLLVRFDDGELGPGRSEDLLSHLSQCEGCSRELDLLRRSLDAATDADPAAAFTDIGQPTMPTALSYKSTLHRLRRMFFGIPVLARFHERFVGAAGLLILAVAAFVAFHELANDGGADVGNVAQQRSVAPADSWSPNGVLALIGLFSRPCETSPRAAPLYPENDRAAIQASIELASARAYMNIMDLPEEALKKYKEIIDRFPGTEAAETARRELSIIVRETS